MKNRIHKKELSLQFIAILIIAILLIFNQTIYASEDTELPEEKQEIASSQSETVIIEDEEIPNSRIKIPKKSAISTELMLLLGASILIGGIVFQRKRQMK